MRGTGLTDPGQFSPVPPDTFGVALISSAGAVVAMDWPASAKIVSFTGQSIDFWVNWVSTQAAVPAATSTGTTATANNNSLNPGLRAVPGGSTGFSLVGVSSGLIGIEYWSR